MWARVMGDWLAVSVEELAVSVEGLADSGEAQSEKPKASCQQPMAKSLTTPLGRRKKKRLPLPCSLSADNRQTLNSWLILRYFSMMPLQFMRPKPCPDVPWSAERLWTSLTL